MQNLSKAKSSTNEKRLKTSQKVTFGFGNLAANLLITTAGSFITYYYVDVLGISMAVVGTLLMLSRIFDGVTDLGMGIIVDKTKSKFGKARPWTLWMAIPYAFALVLLFTSPDIGEKGKVIYAFITYLLAVGIVYTATTVPYNSMIATMTQNQEDRGHLSISRTAFGFFGAMFVNNTVLKVVDLFGGGKNAWTAMAVCFGILSIILWLIVFKNSEEVVVEHVEESHENKTSVLEGVKALFKNKYWVITIFIILVTFISCGLGGINVYYAKYILNDMNMVGPIGTAAFIPVAFASLAVGPLMKKFSNRTIMIGGNLLMVIGFGIVALNPTSIPMVLLGITIKAIGFAPVTVVSFVMLGDCSDYGELKYGTKTEGLIFSASTFGEKVGQGLGAIILSTVLVIGGYAASAQVQSEATMTAIKTVFIYIPMGLATIGAILSSFYKLDEEYDKLKKEV